jgi:hypothetical protein
MEAVGRCNAIGATLKPCNLVKPVPLSGHDKVPSPLSR